MSYDPTNWKSGDVVTSAKLNKMEQGIADASGSSGGGVLAVGMSLVDTSVVLDHTWQEIHDAVMAGQAVTFVPMTGGRVAGMLLVGLKEGDARLPYEVYAAAMEYSSGSVEFQAVAFIGYGADSYPSASMS